MKSGKPYTPVGEVMDRIARESQWHIRGPYHIADFVKERTGYSPARNVWSKYFHGGSTPSPEALIAFCQAFECNREEVIELSVARSFRGRPPLPLEKATTPTIAPARVG